MESHTSHSLSTRAERWIALALCAAVLVARAIEHLVPNRPAYARIFAPDLWPAVVAASSAAAGIMPLDASPQWLRVRRALLWTGLLLMVWVANGLPFDLFRAVRLIPLPVDWPGLATRTLALAAAIVLAHLALARTTAPGSSHAATWYGYAAFILALPYPLLRMHWALNGALGLARPGAAGRGFAPLLIAIPWVLAAAVSLLLVSPRRRRWMPRRLLLTAGYSATAIVALIGPAACWALFSTLASGRDGGLKGAGIALWVPCLFYGSWFLWAIAAAAATRSYQLRTAALPTSSPA